MNNVYGPEESAKIGVLTAAPGTMDLGTVR